jgi:hypothetical protein
MIRKKSLSRCFDVLIVVAFDQSMTAYSACYVVLTIEKDYG